MAGKIFINYRRGEDSGAAGRLFDRLENTFSKDRLFMDVDSIAPGRNFVRVLEDEVGECDVFLAVIGQSWSEARDRAGARRLDKADDFVRIEIESALEQGKIVIPVLVNEAKMPLAEALPGGLKALAYQNAIELRHDRFRSDVDGLVKGIEAALAEAEARRQAAEAAQAVEEERRRAEEEQRQAEEARLAEEAARAAAEAEREEKRRAALAALSREDIARAEELAQQHLELARWTFIQASTAEQDFRDHLARFPNGETAQMARARLEPLVWAKLKPRPSVEALEAFLAEFPEGADAAEAKAKLTLIRNKLPIDDAEIVSNFWSGRFENFAAHPRLVTSTMALISGLISHLAFPIFTSSPGTVPPAGDWTTAVTTAGFYMVPLAFAVVLTFGEFAWRGRRLSAGLIILPAAALGWLLAYSTAYIILIKYPINFSGLLFLAGAVAGAIGAPITAYAVPTLRPARRLIICAVIGAVAGAFLGVPIFNIMPLYFIWQAAFAAYLGHCYSKSLPKVGILRGKKIRPAS